MQTTRRLCALLLSLCFLLCVLCACAPAPSDDTARLQIVTTIFPQYDFVRRLAGERADCTMLLSVGNSDSHAWEPTAAQFATMADADLVLAIGGDGEAWVAETAEAVGIASERVLYLLDTVEGIATAHDHAGHDHAELDEHIWTDPDNAILMVRAIADALCNIDPDGADVYRANEAAYLAELSALSADYHTVLAGATRTLVVADKFPFRYLVHNYGLSVVSAFPGCASDTEPSLGVVQELIAAVEREHARVVLYVTHSSPKIAAVVTEATGTSTRILHACHTVSAAELAAGESYLSLMRQNLIVLEEALAP